MLPTRSVFGLLASALLLSVLTILLASGIAGHVGAQDLAANLAVDQAASEAEGCKGLLVEEDCKSEAGVIKSIQATFNAAGCDVGAVDGVMGRRTRGWLKVHDTIWDDVSYQALFDQQRGDDLLVRVELLSGMVCGRAYQMSGECQAAYAKWKQAPGAGAFAVSGLGGCASASGYTSVSAAQSAVLARCSKNGTSCRIQDTKAGRSGSDSACDTGDPAYRKLSSPKALIEGSNGCYIYSGGTRLALRSKALRYCRSKGGSNCRVVDTQ